MATYSRRRLIRGSLIFVATAVLNACGQKGPLYLPEENEDEKKKKMKNPPPSADADPRTSEFFCAETLRVLYNRT